VSGRIRDARPHELALAGELTAQAYAPILAFGADDPYLAELRDAAARAEKAQLLVYVSPSDEIQGTITVARPGIPYAEIAAPHELEVRMLAVSPAAQGQGIGAHLMAHVHDVARGEGFSSVALSVIGTNVGALAFYRRLGYEPDSERDWYPVPEMPAPLKVLVKDLSASR
jgi:ribosomal protein S18 acetylase RimI-like enzyme